MEPQSNRCPRKRKPYTSSWIKLADHLGNFIGQMTDEPIKAINILYDGVASEMNLGALTSAAVRSWGR